MDKKNIVFTTKETIRNIDFIEVNDRVITYGEGEIKELRINNKEINYPLLIGEYFYYKIFLNEIRRENLNLHETLSFLDDDDSIDDFLSLIYHNNDFYDKVMEKNRLIIISHLVISKKKRKNNIIFSEFINSFNRQHNSNDVMILGYFKPLQYNNYFINFVLENKQLEIKNKKGNKTVMAEEYYELSSLSKNNDYEYDCLKTHSLTTKNNFKEVDREKHFFIYLP